MVNTGPLVPEGYKSYEEILSSVDSSSTLRRQANLVLSDPYYSTQYARAYKRVGHSKAVQQLHTAGCFDDTLEERITPDTRFLSAPYPRIKDNLAMLGTDRKPAVVLSTGSFDPLHTGHVETLVRAKEFIDASSEYEVIGGLLSGSHDHYVRSKNVGGINGFGRLSQNMDFLDRHAANHSDINDGNAWIFYESMESIGADVAWNFTDVIIHVQAMLERYVAEGIKVFFVFGSDNAEFSLAFTHDDKSLAESVCVYRPGYELSPSTKEAIETSTTAHFTLGYSSESSTNVRGLAVAEEEPTPHRVMALRNDMDLSMDWARSFFTEKEFEVRKKNFLNVLTDELDKSFGEILTIDVDEQVKVTEEFIQENFPNRNILSCDVYFKGDETIRCSRLFDVSGVQTHGFGTTYNGEPETQGVDYVFVDDDICSGNFLAEMRKFHNITDTVSMADIYLDVPYNDIVDVRDFIVGASHGGLMVMLDKAARVPYLNPFTNVDTRASILRKNIAEFNKNMWKANVDFYKDSGITLDQLPEGQNDFMEYVGFDKTVTVEEAVTYFWRKM